QKPARRPTHLQSHSQHQHLDADDQPVTSRPWAKAPLGVAVITAAGGIGTVIVGRRQPRGQQRRDDFTAVTDTMAKDIERLERRADESDREAEVLQVRVTAQDFTIRYLVGWIRGMVGYIRASGLEPPPPPQLVPDEVRPYLHDVGV
ncbi:hypothetical protein ABZ461_39415, partial [Actinacidiphila glaucinigra]|uniref:hypothetical protein n=1 Tax=Actinacidiphila glaucinigra TaxID=235986 RepID=UPI0033DED665